MITLSLYNTFILIITHVHPLNTGTLIAAVDLLAAAKATVVECACMVELKMLAGSAKLQEKHPSVPVWALISEDILQLEGKEGQVPF